MYVITPFTCPALPMPNPRVLIPSSFSVARKCGGVICRACTPHTTPFLDATTLPFVYPPCGTPVHGYICITSPVPAHICDACYAQIHGTSPRSPSHSPSPSSSSPAPPSTSWPPVSCRSRTVPAPDLLPADDLQHSANPALAITHEWHGPHGSLFVRITFGTTFDTTPSSLCK
jgi:hypothetical protein